MHRGYIKLWRKMFDSGIHKEHSTFVLWVWILANVTHKPLNYIVRGQQIRLAPGEMIIGRKKLSIELGIREKSVRTCLKNLKNWGNVAIRTTNRFSIIKVNNWELYQDNDLLKGQQTGQERASNGPATGQERATKQEVKNVKKKRRESGISGGNGIPEWISKDLWSDFREFRIRIKAPLTDRATKNIISELEKFRNEGQDPEAIINQSITRGWRGVFKIKGGGDDCPGFDWSKP
jgi:hypothetical protein